MKVFLGFLLVYILKQAYGSNILVMLPLPLYSHTHSYLPIFTELARRGHNVTMVSPYPMKKPIPNFNEVIIDDIWETFLKDMMSTFDPRDMDGFLLRVLGIWKFCPLMIDNVLKEAKLNAFLNDTNSKFDLVITETFFCQEPFIAVGYKYGAIQVAIQTINLPISVAYLTGNMYNPSYMPTYKFPFSQHMDFWERSKNTFVNIFEHIIYQAGWLYSDYTMRNNFMYPGFENLPPIKDMLKNVSLILLDNHLSLSYPRPYLPNVIEIGGLTIKEGAKLPEDLDKFMNESQEGVIYFSWGSHYKTKHMKPHVVSAFMSAFGKLKQRILMKVDQETLPGKPDNVMLSKWFPQASILAHPKLRVFISHGGIHGMLEAVYNGVPILGTPLFADHEYNLKLTGEAGFSINVNIDTVTEKIVSDAINRLLTDSSYKENAVKRSKIMKDRPLNVLDNAIYWIEYLLRHNGAPHLRSAAVDLPWYQLILIDVLVFWGTIFTLTVFLWIKLFNFLCRYCKSKKNLKKKNKVD